MNILPIIIMIVVVFLIDLYAFKGVSFFMEDVSRVWMKKTVTYVYWGLFVLFAAGIVSAFMLSSSNAPHKMYSWYYSLFGLFLLLYLPKLFFIVFELMDDIVYIVRLAGEKLFASDTEDSGRQISRAKFLYQTGAVVAAIPFIGVAYGILKGRFDYRVIQKQLSFGHLPEAFNGLKIVQISDAHLGSFFNNFRPVERAVEMVNALQPDIIVFTGDLVNNYSDEAEDWIDVFRRFKAKVGKYSVVGNHDYGDYGRWSSKEAKARSFERIQEIHREMGFNVLMNDGEVIDRGGQKIGILGVENWGIKPFPQYGDVAKAKEKIGEVPFKVLLSHDPSHWDEVVRKAHQDVDITLSGHTHGMQFGIELGNIKWSPVKYKYPRWAGLYQEAQQYLYVNRGFGYIGFPGRVGMPPEITLLELKKA